jgi:hypothetical protein
LAHQVISLPRGSRVASERGIRVIAAQGTTRVKLKIAWPAFPRILGLDGRENYRKMRLEPLCCLTVQAEAAPHEREYPRRKRPLLSRKIG